MASLNRITGHFAADCWQVCGGRLDHFQTDRALGLKQYNITNYERGTRLPNAQKIMEIAQALHVTIEDIYGKVTSSTPVPPRKAANSREKQMVEVFAKLTPTEQRVILKQAKGLIKE